MIGSAPEFDGELVRPLSRFRSRLWRL